MKRALMAGMLVLSGACATSSPPPPVATGPVSVDTTPLRMRHAVRPVPYTNAFAAAIERGTRTDDGRPGSNYWQQRVEYRIEAELDPATARLSGAETIVYHNNSPDTLRELRFMLYQNAFAPGVQRVEQINQILATDPAAKEYMAKHACARVDVNQLEGGSIAKKYQIFKVPAFLVIAPDAQSSTRSLPGQGATWQQVASDLAPL